MRLFDMTAEQRKEWVAKQMGFHPDPSTWPRDLIDEIINKAGRAAERQIAEEVAKLGSRYFSQRAR